MLNKTEVQKWEEGITNRTIKADVMELDGIRYYRYPESKKSWEKEVITPVLMNIRDKVTSTYHRDLWRKYKGDIPEGFDIHHIDGNHLNNYIENFELTRREHIKKA